MQERSKLQSYLGFSIRAGKLVMGVNAIECTRKRIYALVMCSSAAKNTRKDAEKLRDRLQVPLCIADDLAELVKKENCKLCAMLDRSLSGAVLELFAGEAIAPKPRREVFGEWEPLTSEEEASFRVEKNGGEERASKKQSEARLQRNTKRSESSAENGRKPIPVRGASKKPSSKRAEENGDRSRSYKRADGKANYGAQERYGESKRGERGNRKPVRSGSSFGRTGARTSSDSSAERRGGNWKGNTEARRRVRTDGKNIAADRPQRRTDRPTKGSRNVR